MGKKYEEEGAKKISDLVFKFREDSDHISIDIPMDEGVKKDGWWISALVYPMVSGLLDMSCDA